MKKYILINSYPRSGGNFLETCLNAMYGDTKGNDILLDTPAKVLHSPELLLEKLNNILQVSIIRDPAECIASFIIKDIGFMLRVPSLKEEHKLNLYLKSKIDYYCQYIDAINKNIDNIQVLKFEDIKNDTKAQLKKISTLMELPYDGDLEEVILKSKKYLKERSTYNYFHNSIPIEKPKAYSQYLEYINDVYDKEMLLIRSSIEKIFN